MPHGNSIDLSSSRNYETKPNLNKDEALIMIMNMDPYSSEIFSVYFKNYQFLLLKLNNVTVFEEPPSITNEPNEVYSTF